MVDEATKRRRARHAALKPRPAPAPVAKSQATCAAVLEARDGRRSTVYFRSVAAAGRYAACQGTAFDLCTVKNRRNEPVVQYVRSRRGRGLTWQKVPGPYFLDREWFLSH